MRRRDRRKLTQREYQVLLLLAAGNEYQDIGRALIITNNTVQFHVCNILMKFDAINVRHAIAIALRRNLLTKEQIPEISFCD
jgi:DNA-binding CsgD family transcriptional regulator